MIADAAFDALPTAEQEKRLTRFAETALTAWADDWRPRRLIKYRENAVFEIATAPAAVPCCASTGPAITAIPRCDRN